MKQEVILLLGSNMGNREELLQQARETLNSKIGTITQLSELYETEPWGFEAQHDFLNQVVTLQSELDAHTLLSRTQEIEAHAGRVRAADGRFISRTLDIDILFYANQQIDTPELQVPHPHLHKRRFTLIPLTDNHAEMQHPTLHKTIRQLLDECPDKLPVKNYTATHKHKKAASY
ncbi:MAG: 2-amino-4-hydroxy-6-hydroxymethyldihydropteridine diphosphokinase [Bacteroidota bacterium]